MPAIQLAKRLRRECELGEYYIIDGQWTGWHYLYKALEAAANCERQGGNWSPEIVHMLCRGQTLQNDEYFVEGLPFELLSWSGEPEIHNLLSKVYWNFIYSDAEAIYKLLVEFYDAVEPS